jgi:WD40 repeat protein
MPRGRGTITIAALTSAALIAACGADGPPSSPRPSGPSLNAFAHSEWSEPAHLDAPVNSPSRELGASLSADGLSIYFGSDRQTGSLGNIDIWVARRACVECPWQTPANLGPNINSAQSDGGPELSQDGHVLFFSSNRTPGTLGGDDIWVSFRTDVHDDLGWGPAVNLGPDVNTDGHETGPAYNAALRAGGGNLYFVRGAPTSDIFQVVVSRTGEALGPATPVAELNSLAVEGEPSIRADGREIVFHSGRTGGFGLLDLWVATRPNPHVEWSTPVNLGAAINTQGADLTPFLSRHGRTLLWSVGVGARPSLGLQDIWMSTRMPGRGEE